LTLDTKSSQKSYGVRKGVVKSRIEFQSDLEGREENIRREVGANEGETAGLMTLSDI
jgi:hypothetical protein